MLMKQGATGLSIGVFVRKSDGTAYTGLAYNTSGLTASYLRENGAVQTVLLTSSNWQETSPTTLPGRYQFTVPDAAVAAGAKWVELAFFGAADMLPVMQRLQLVAFDPQAADLGGVAMEATAVHPADLDPFARTSDIPTVQSIQSGLAKTSDLSGFAKTTDIPAVPTVEQIQDGLARSSELSSLATSAQAEGVLAAIAAIPSPAGPGSVNRTVKITDAAGNPVAGAEVWLTTDEAGTQAVSGVRVTNDLGEAAFMVDPGAAYFIWVDSATAEFVNPTAWQVTQ